MCSLLSCQPPGPARGRVNSAGDQAFELAHAISTRAGRQRGNALISDGIMIFVARLVGSGGEGLETLET